MLLLLFACSNEIDTGELNCSDAPEVNYNNFGDAFFRHNCQGCHASSTEDRYGAPESVVFDTVDQIWNWKDKIVDTTLGENNKMPPAGSITENDQAMLYWWLECGKEGR